MCVLFLLSLRFGQISLLAFFRWFTATSDGMLSLVTVSPVITAFHSCLSHHFFFFFYEVNLWPAWVGFETAIFWQCSPGTVETQRLYPLRLLYSGQTLILGVVLSLCRGDWQVFLSPIGRAISSIVPWSYDQNFHYNMNHRGGACSVTEIDPVIQVRIPNESSFFSHR